MANLTDAGCQDPTLPCPDSASSSNKGKDMPDGPRELAAAMFRMAEKGAEYNLDRQNQD